MDNARVGVRRAQHLEVQNPVDRDIHGVAGAPRDDPFAKRIRQARAAGFARDVLFDTCNAAERIGDRTIAGAPAQVAFEGVGQVGALILIERSGRHDHAGGAEAALKRLRIEKGALHRMQGVIGREPLDGRDRASGGTECRHQAGVHRRAIEPHRAGAAVAGVAAVLDAEEAPLTQEGAQALPGFRLGRNELAVDGVVHTPLSGRASSTRICSAK